jgi:hypothetical protein
MQRIILVGFIGSGKNTVGEYLVEKHGYFGISFADALKDVVASMFCWDRVLLEGNTPAARKWREAVDEWWAKRLGIPDFTPRYAMRHIGTEVLRDGFNDAIWRLNVERRIEQAGSRPVVVFDGRFRKEIELVRNMGGTAVRVRRGDEPDYWDLAIKANNGDTEAAGLLGFRGIHRSDWEWIGTPMDVEIENNETVRALHAKVDRLVERMK